MTQDNAMDVSPSWQELKDERDALAAHVERLTGTIEFLLDTGEWSSHVAVSQMAKGDISLAPTTSLARLKAEWQAEALEDAADSCHEPAQSARGMHDTGVWLRHMADELRRQAKEAPCDMQ